jgi:hypothetical protein
MRAVLVMRRRTTKRLLVASIIILAALSWAAGAWHAYALKMTKNDIELFLAVEDYCRYFGRMPAHFDDLVSTGYLERVEGSDGSGFRRYWIVGSAAPPISSSKKTRSDVLITNPTHVSFAWGLTASDLRRQGGRLYYGHKPGEARLVRWGMPWITDLERKWSIELFDAMLAGHPEQAATRKSRDGPEIGG